MRSSSNLLRRFAPAMLAAIASHKYDETVEGVLFPKLGLLAHGEYFYDTNGENPGTSPNMLPVQGLNYLLTAGVLGGAASSTWYLALFSGAYTPVDTVTAATFTAAATEITSPSQGYSESTRQPWVGSAADLGVTDNTASKAAFSIKTTTSLVIRGAAMLSAQAKGATTGTLLSISRFASDRTHFEGDTFNLGYRLRLRQPT